MEYLLKLNKAGKLHQVIMNTDRRRIFQFFVQDFDKNDEWLTISKKSFDTIMDEVLINAPLLLIGVGVASLAVRAGLGVVGRVAVGVGLLSRANRVGRLTLKTIIRLKRAYRSGHLGVQALAFAGKTTQAFAQGVVEGVFEQVISLQFLEQYVSGTAVKDTTGQEWVKALATEGFGEALFELSGGLTGKIFNRTAKYTNIYGKQRFGHVQSG